MHALACEYAKQPTDEMLNAAVDAALPLCALIARRFSGRGVDDEDLYQVASMALVAALRGFDISRGLRFTTYATPVITGTVRNYLRDKGSILRTPRRMQEQAAALKKCRSNLTDALRREPSAKELAQALSWSVVQVLETLTMLENAAVSSLDAPDAEGRMPAETLGFSDAAFEQFENRSDLNAALSILSEDEKALLRFRFSERLSQRETAVQLGVSQMQVSRMERRALQTLRKTIEGGETKRTSHS